MPLRNGPVLDVTSPDIFCNVNLTPPRTTVPVAPGALLDSITMVFIICRYIFRIGLRTSCGRLGWDGCGERWYKPCRRHPAGRRSSTLIIRYDSRMLTTTLPVDIPVGEMNRVQWYISCAQISSKVSTPGYVSPDDPGITVNIYYPVPTAYTIRVRWFVRHFI
ncbi:uncharacterized protein BT62DRAFT_971965 [Guyanagaster necrorhizus]|uniref:Uncharacterized protein n=1 Tax=Guyanagaster necrorhizus TaxID=856835 RepID=A0A9P7VN51_9AGAR|nr:uncharacterized protein BT62DRAFT_971965 [Guyanagaster necrorhizus MCA 3950]KAG7443784.1 hypothetical protein BT62DRAFT_971965 [Guyanagaster necrorhizus MCA 3950]